jgi:hypothetical protein
MSIVSFNRKFTGSVKVTGSSYDTRGFVFRDKAYSGYTGNFDFEYRASGASLPIREQTCSPDPDHNKDYCRPLFTSGVTESGYANFGFPNFVQQSFLAKTLPANYGYWLANTEPEIEYEVDSDNIGKVTIDGEAAAETRVYIVKNPIKDLGKDVARNDVPIHLAAGVVTNAVPAVVYEGDLIYIYRNDFVVTPEDPENLLIRIIRQKRYPATDRTFVWTPNTSPVLKKGGYSDGVLVKPGTVMIPNATTSLRAYDGGVGPPPSIPPDEVLTIDYVYAGMGIMFDGTDWVSLVGVPERLLKKDGKYDHRNINLNLKYIDEDQPHIALTESFYANRPFILLSAPSDGNGQAQLTAFKPDPPDPGPEPEDLNLELFSFPRAFFILLHDFQDAWSKYHQDNKDWRDTINIAYGTRYTFGWGGFNPEKQPDPPAEPIEEFFVYAPAQTFRDGEVTEVEVKDQDGNTVAGSTLSTTISVQFG